MRTLERLLKALEQDPKNVHLMNSIALAYFEDFSAKEDREDYDYFLKAYQTEKTVKTAHNLAWFLYFEFSEIEWRWEEDQAIEQALSIQREALALQPQSYFPYYQYAYMLMHQERYAEAIPFLEAAKLRSDDFGIVHNLAYCLLIKGDYAEALAYWPVLEKRSEDERNRSLFNACIAAYALGDIASCTQLMKELRTKIDTRNMGAVSMYELAQFYCVVEDYASAVDCLEEQGLRWISLLDWRALAYALYREDKSQWQEVLEKDIEERLAWIAEIERGDASWEDHSQEMKMERLGVFRQEIAERERLIVEGMSKVKVDWKKMAQLEYCGCLLFDCKRHRNPMDD